MPRADNTQFNVRSAYVRDRSAYARDCSREIARRTGMTTTEIVEDALRGYVPPGMSEPVDGLVRRGPILVKPAQKRRVTHDEADQALDAVRRRDS